MNFKRIFRTLVCLVLVCALLVGVSPIKARALVPESIMVSAGIVIGSVLLGLGVGMAADSTSDVLVDMVTGCQDFLTLNYDFVSDEQKIEIWTNASLDIPYVVDQRLIEAVRTWLFENYNIDVETGEIGSKPEQTLLSDSWVTGETSVSALSTTASGTEVSVAFTLSCSDPYIPIIYSYTDSNYVYWQLLAYFGNSKPGTFRVNGSAKTLFEQSGVYYYPIYSSMYTLVSHSFSDVQYFDLGTLESSSDVLPTFFELIDTRLGESGGELLYTSTGYIAAESISLEEAYATWAAGAISIPKESDEGVVITGYPVGLASTQEETLALSQTDVWQGLSTYAQTGGEVTDPDDGNNDDTSELTLSDVTVTTFLAKLLADLTKGLLGSKTTSLTEILGSQMIEFRAMFRELQDALVQGLTDIASFIKSLPQEFADLFTQLKNAILGLPSEFADWLGQIKEAILGLPQKFELWFTTLIEFVEAIGEFLKSTVVPDTDYLTDKVDALCAEFAFVDSIVRTGQALKVGLAGVTTEPPVIYIDLGATRGSYDIGGKVVFIDMTWYAEYKPTVDAIISAFLWICFAWRMLIKLPGIINGMPGDFVMTSAHQMGVTDYLPARSKEYEIQRISNREMIRKGPDK